MGRVANVMETSEGQGGVERVCHGRGPCKMNKVLVGREHRGPRGVANMGLFSVAIPSLRHSTV